MSDQVPASEWGIAGEVWASFCAHHPELGLRPGRWQLINFMRVAKHALLAGDAIRKARAGHWIAHRARFDALAFELLTQREVAA
jgi:hypothetical protein